MEILSVSAAAPDVTAVEHAVAVLFAGGLLIYPTDTLYGLGACARDGAAVARLRGAKGREPGKPLPLIAADGAQARSLCARWPAAASVLAGRFWPGPLTLVLPAAPGLPEDVTADTGTVALRVPAAPLCVQIARGAGPIVSTSANQAGAPAPLTCAQAVAQIPGAALALDAGPGRPVPSTIVDLCGTEPRLLREGAIPFAEVLTALAR